MKKIIFLMLFICLKSFSQINFQDHTINSNVDDARSVFSADVDNDGDMDVLVASQDDNQIYWYENLDSQGNFGSANIITSNIDGIVIIYAIDIDNDNDIDVLSASIHDDKIAWYENLDGQGNFGNQQTISTNANFATSVFAIDIDNDGDVDVLSSSHSDDKIAWYENLDGQGNFGNQQIIATTNASISVYSADIDGDGDIDVLSASDSNVSWYENLDGQGNFGNQQVISTSLKPWVVYAVDIDNDGDIDVVSNSNSIFSDDKIVWFENLDSQGSFSTEKIITTNVDTTFSIYSGDLDNDGDTDIFSASVGDNKIAWYENLDGQGNFGTQQIVSINAGGASSVFTADIDNDGDIDVLSSSSSDNKVSWYENTGTLSLNNHTNFSFVLYPNPANNYLKIQQIEVSIIKIYNEIGALVIEKFDENEVDLSKLSKGIYIIKITDVNGNTDVKKVIKE